jgi:hypothetical protein
MASGLAVGLGSIHRMSRELGTARHHVHLQECLDQFLQRTDRRMISTPHDLLVVSSAIWTLLDLDVRRDVNEWQYSHEAAADLSRHLEVGVIMHAIALVGKIGSSPACSSHYTRCSSIFEYRCTRISYSNRTFLIIS